jgi:hypothetical protein
MNDAIRISSPADILGFIPHSLGFVPRESFVFLGVAYAGGGGQSIFVPVETLAQVLKNPSGYSNGSKCDGAL